ELIHLAGPENKDQVLEELSEYVGKTGGFLANYLWGSIKEKPYNWWNLVKARYPVLSSIALKLLSIPATSASSERNWSSFNFTLSVKELRNRGYLIEDNVVNSELNETNSVEKNNIDDTLSDSPLYIVSMDYTDEIDDMDINENVDYLDSTEDMNNMDNMDNMDSINDMSNNEQIE
ncbi:21188_t:CDS:2, partial [Gigaspora rosea]